MKSKIIKILISCLLLTTFLFSGVACKGESNPAISSEQGYTFSKSNRISYEGTHIRNIDDTSIDLVKDGRTEYVLVMSQKAISEVSKVKDDFIILFRKATGITLPVKQDVQVVNDWDESKKYISVGDNLLVKKANIDKSEYSIDAIKQEGVRIITKGNTQFLLGGDWAGEINAMYEFLTIYFNFDCYERSSISLDTGISNLKLKNIDLTEVPDVDYYLGNSGKYRYTLTPEPWDKYSLGSEYCEKEVAVSYHRLREHYVLSTFLQIYAKFTDTGTINGFHNLTRYVIPKKSQHEIPDYIWKYKDEVGFYNEEPNIDAHDKMYPDGGGNQFCFTAHGDQDVFEDMIDLCAAKIIHGLIVAERNHFYRYATLTIEDNWDFCNCPQCSSDIEKYASSGVVVRFANKVGEIVGKWLEIQKDEDAEYHSAYREDFKILIFGYHRDTAPPVDATTNPDGSVTFTPKDPSVVFNDYTAIWLVEDDEYGEVNVYDSLQGSFYEEYLPGWNAVKGPKGGQFFWYNSPSVAARDHAYDDLSQYSSDFWEVLAYYGYRGVFMDHFSGAFEQSGWHGLVNYVCSKLRWNCHYDTDALIRKYMKGMFLDAADVMYDIYQDVRLHYVNIRANEDDPSNHPTLSKSDYYPYPILEGWINKYEVAKDKVAHYKDTNPDLYIAVKTRIEIEEIGEILKAIDYYEEETIRPYSRETLDKYKAIVANLAELCPRLSWQGDDISSFIGG